METTARIVVDDGTLDVPIMNTLGEEVGHIRFRPTDIGILKRIKEVEGRLGEVVAPLGAANIESDGTGETELDQEVLDRVEKALYEEINYVFNADVAEEFFGRMQPFSPVNGEFYCTIALDALFKFVASVIDEQTKLVNERVDKYTHGYKSGKHKDGKKK